MWVRPRRRRASARPPVVALGGEAVGGKAEPGGGGVGVARALLDLAQAQHGGRLDAAIAGGRRAGQRRLGVLPGAGEVPAVRAHPGPGHQQPHPAGDRLVAGQLDGPVEGPLGRGEDVGAAGPGGPTP